MKGAEFVEPCALTPSSRDSYRVRPRLTGWRPGEQGRSTSGPLPTTPMLVLVMTILATTTLVNAKTVAHVEDTVNPLGQQTQLREPNPHRLLRNLEIPRQISDDGAHCLGPLIAAQRPQDDWLLALEGQAHLRRRH